MIQLLKKFIIPYIFNDKKIYLTIISLLFFTIIYSYCENNEFHGWIDTSRFRTKIEKNFVTKLYNKFTNKDYGYLTLDQFLKMPIIVDQNKFYFTDDEKQVKEKNNLDAKKILFSIYDKSNKGKISYNNFLELPIELGSVKDYTESYKRITPLDHDATNIHAVSTIFDRFYFSIIIQSNLGLGDIFPASKRVRLIMILQICISYIIIILPYSVFSFMG